MDDLKLNKRILQLNEIQKFSTDVDLLFDQMLNEFNWNSDEIGTGLIDSSTTIDLSQDLNEYSKSVSSSQTSTVFNDKFLNRDLIKEYHKYCSKVEKNKQKTQRKSKRKPLYTSSKRLTYTEVLRNLIQHQNQTMFQN